MITNAEIASLLEELAQLTTLEDGSVQSFRVRAYERASRAAATHAEPLAGLSETAIAKVPGLGKSTARKIAEVAATGRIAKLDVLRERFPPAFLEVTRVPGIGPKTAVLLRDELGVGSIEDLRAAAEAEQVQALPGLGAKAEAKILQAIDRLGDIGKERRAPIATAMKAAADVIAALESVPGAVRAEYMGSLRRFRETIGDLDVVALSEGNPMAVMERFVSMPAVREVIAHGDRKSAVVAASGLQIDLRVVEPHQFGSAALYFTGSKGHNIRLRQMAIDRGWTLNEYGLSDAATGEVIAAGTELEIYSALGLPWIPPELREDSGEIEAALAGALPDLVEEDHLRGDLHVHTDLSGDGRAPLSAMLEAAAARDYEYLAITDHGEEIATNGVSREAMLEQRRQLEEFQTRFPEMTLLQGCELNIAADGSIDYDPGFLAGFGWGVASVHEAFDLDRETQTTRIITAMRNPAVNAIGHLSGRYLGRRPGIDLDLEAVFTAAEETGAAIEINSSLERLDASAEVLRRARDRTVQFVISTDAHDTAALGGARWGVANARRGWVEKDRVVNTWPRDRFLEWVAAKRAR